MIHHVPQGELNLDTLGAVVRRELSDGWVRRIILDSLAELVVAVRETDRFPAYARSLIGFIRAAGASVLVTSETTALGPEAEPIGGLSFLFNNVLLLRYIEMESETRRALSILKMRDSDHAKGVYQFEIDAQGFKLMDKLEGADGSARMECPERPSRQRPPGLASPPRRRRNRKRAPSGCPGSYQMRPPNPSSRAWAMASPRPEP